jgi:hypothetical protein
MAKKQSNDEKIIGAMDALSRSICNLGNLRNKYNNYIDEAALRGDDARAKQLIKQKIRLSALIRQFETLNSNIALGVYTSQALSELGKLPAAIVGCKGLLAESPDFSKLGKSIASIYKDIGKSESELADLNKLFEPIPIRSVSSRLDEIPEDEKSDEFKAEYAAMIERLKPIPDSVQQPKDIDITDGLTSTGNIDYKGIVDEENKKK